MRKGKKEEHRDEEMRMPADEFDRIMREAFQVQPPKPKAKKPKHSGRKPAGK